MKFSGKNKKMTALIAAAIAVCVTGGAATAAYAYYVNKQLSQSNTISIGQTVETLVIGADSTSENQELYPGDSATFTYSLEVENYAGSATVTTALSTGEADTNFDAAYFTVTYTVGEDQTVYSNDEPYTVTSADNGKNIVITVTMNDEEPCYTFANMPTFSTVTLTVSLVEGEFVGYVSCRRLPFEAKPLEFGGIQQQHTDAQAVFRCFQLLNVGRTGFRVGFVRRAGSEHRSRCKQI